VGSRQYSCKKEQFEEGRDHLTQYPTMIFHFSYKSAKLKEISIIKKWVFSQQLWAAATSSSIILTKREGWVSSSYVGHSNFGMAGTLVFLKQRSVFRSIW
jgi:hypothetical protein